MKDELFQVDSIWENVFSRREAIIVCRGDNGVGFRYLGGNEFQECREEDFLRLFHKKSSPQSKLPTKLPMAVVKAYLARGQAA